MRLTPIDVLVRSICLPGVCLLAMTCSHGSSAGDFPKLAEEFVYKTLSFSPVFASSQGLHQYNGVSFDTRLDDVNFRTIQQQRNFYSEFHKRLEAFDKNSLSPEDRADYDMIDSQI